MTAEVLPAYLVHWDAPSWCACAAESLLASRGVSIRVMVVDNGQRTGPPLADLLSPRVRVLRSGGNLGYAGGANIALADWARSFPASPVCLIGSHDLQVGPDTVRELLRRARANQEYGILGPTIEVPVEGSLFRSSGGVWRRGGAIQLPLGEARGIEERDWASGTCLLIRRDCVNDIGSFDERFGSYVEDVDLCLRANDAGWKVGVVATAVASTVGSASPNGVGLNEANLILLTVKRQGLSRGLIGCMRVLLDGARSLGGSLAPWRNRTRRETSRYFLAQHVHAAQTLLRKRALIRALGRERAG